MALAVQKHYGPEIADQTDILKKIKTTGCRGKKKSGAGQKSEEEEYFFSRPPGKKRSGPVSGSRGTQIQGSEL